MAVKTFVGTGDNPYTAALDIYNQVHAWLISIIPNTEVIEIENSSTGAKYKKHGIVSKGGTLGFGTMLLDAYQGFDEPRFSHGIYGAGSIFGNTDINLRSYYDTAQKIMNFNVTYARLPQGIYIDYCGKFGMYFNEELNEHIFFGTSRNGQTIAIASTGKVEAKQFPGYTVPQPQPNKCTVSNAIYGGKLLSNMFAYNCNPVLGPYQEVMLGGEKYFTLPNNCCIKL